MSIVEIANVRISKVFGPRLVWQERSYTHEFMGGGVVVIGDLDSEYGVSF